jgi:hypothetical protein
MKKIIVTFNPKDDSHWLFELFRSMAINKKKEVKKLISKK